MRPTSEFPDPYDGPLANPLDSARLQEIYSRTAAFYDQVVAEHQAAAKLIAIEMLDRKPGERFLEIALGTGWAFQHLVATSGTENAYGLELAPGMIAVARDRLGPGPGLLLGDSARLPFRDSSLDAVLCTYTLECMPVSLIDESLAEMRRVLASDGRVVVADLTEGEGDEDAVMTEEWKAGFKRDPEFYGGARPLRLGPLLETAGLSVIERRYSGHGESWPSEIVLALHQ
jgi:ubiquinone/menaquinone biosynthesis C-methylase UbiE